MTNARKTFITQRVVNVKTSYEEEYRQVDQAMSQVNSELEATHDDYLERMKQLEQREAVLLQKRQEVEHRQKETQEYIAKQVEV